MSELGEHLSGHVEQLDLEGLAAGDIVYITAGVGEDAYHYRFLVEEANNWPKGKLEETKPDGTMVGPLPIIVHGSGQWTTKLQNPLQVQEYAFTSHFDSICCGDFLVCADPDASYGNRLVFDEPGQEISTITVEQRRDQLSIN